VAESRETVIPSLGLIVLRGWATSGLLNQIAVQHTLDGLVEGPGTKLDDTIGAPFHLLFHGVAVPFSLRQDQQDV
jgi:hypothetical protein